MRFIWSAFEFRMVLYGDKETVVSDLHGLYKPVVGRSAADAHAAFGQILSEVVVEFISVAMPLGDRVSTVYFL